MLEKSNSCRAWSANGDAAMAAATGATVSEVAIPTKQQTNKLAAERNTQQWVLSPRDDVVQTLPR